MINKRKQGARAEKVACEYLKLQGYEILEQNFYAKTGEIDIIAKEDHVLVFIEVKYRRDGRLGMPGEAVNWKKQQKIRNTAMWYLKTKHLSFDQPMRFDVVEILGKKIRVIKYAF